MNQQTVAVGVVPGAIAELMGVPVILGAENVEIDDEAVTAEAPVGSGRARVQAQLPLVLSITERNPEPRFPSFKGIIAAKRRPLHQVAGELPETEAVSRVDHVEAAPAKQAGTILEDDGTAVSQLVAFLRERGL
jgi:electron transfer flavoprotein beta subunit